MKDASLRSIALYGARELIADLGGDPWGIAHAAGLPPEALDRLDLVIPVHNFVLFLDLAARQTGREDFGLLLAERQSMGILGGALLDLVSDAKTIGEWLERLSRYFYLLTDGALISLEPHELGLTLIYEITAAGDADDAQACQVGLALVVRKLRSVLSPHWTPERVLLRGREPRKRGPLQRLFGQNLFFNQECNALLISHRALAQPLRDERPSTRPDLLEFMRDNQQRRSRSPRLNTADTVHKLLASNGARLDAVAAEQLQSQRTLQRHLAKSGTSFQAIKIEVKLDLACKYLRQTDLKLSQIAEALGFSSLSAFSRFFRNAKGCAPRDYRKDAKATPGSR